MRKRLSALLNHLTECYVRGVAALRIARPRTRSAPNGRGASLGICVNQADCIITSPFDSPNLAQCDVRVRVDDERAWQGCRMFACCPLIFASLIFPKCLLRARGRGKEEREGRVLLCCCPVAQQRERERGQKVARLPIPSLSALILSAHSLNLQFPAKLLHADMPHNWSAGYLHPNSLRRIHHFILGVDRHAHAEMSSCASCKPRKGGAFRKIRGYEHLLAASGTGCSTSLYFGVANPRQSIDCANDEHFKLSET